MSKAISSFQGSYRFLSNFYPCDIFGYPSVEHYYQAQKSLDKAEQEVVKQASTPGQSKRLGKQVKHLRKDWEEVKVGAMYDAVLEKFSKRNSLKKKLLATGKAFLQEGNTWHDNYWGNCCCKKCQFIKGKNKLGQILMSVRASLGNTK